MTATIERSEYNADIKEFTRWTNSNELYRFSRDNETKEEYRAVLNEAILTDFYAAVGWLLSRGYDEYHEIISRTISPAEQNPFYAMREYRVKRNGHYKLINIYQHFWGGCVITERNF